MTVQRAPYTLAAGQILVSSNKAYTLSIDAQGRAQIVAAAGDAVIWRSGGSQGTKLILQTDGNLVLYLADGSAAWSSNTASHGFDDDSFDLNLADDGTLSIVNSSWWGSKTIWVSVSLAQAAAQRHDEGLLVGGNDLAAGDYLRSHNKAYTLTLETPQGVVMTPLTKEQNC